MSIRNQKGLVVGALFVLGASAMNAMAETNDTGWYIGGGAGSAATELDWDIVGSDETKFSSMLYGGYNFNAFFGIESMGFITGDLSNDQEGISDAYLSGLSLTPKLTLRVSPSVALFAKAGIASMYYSEEVEVERDSGSWRYSRSENYSWSDVVWTLGVGAEFSVTDSLRLRLAYDYFDGTLDYDDEDYDYYYYGDYYRYNEVDLEDLDVNVGMASLGLHYQF